MPLRGRTRRTWLAVHRWLGLGLGGAFALLGLTGSLLVFYLDIDEWLHPSIVASDHAPAAAPAGRGVSPDAVLERLRARHPQRTGPWRIELPLDDTSPVRARYFAPVERAGRSFAPLVVVLDPASLAVRREGFWGDDVMTWIYDLHYSLLLDRPGGVAVGVLGVVMLGSLAGGIALWWPSRRRWRDALRPTPRPGIVRRIHDLHALAGVYSAVVLLVLALTGAALALPAQARWLLAAAGLEPRASGAAMRHGHVPVADGQPGAQDAPPRPGSRLSLDAARVIAAAEFPAADVRWIETSGARGEPVMLRMHQPGEPSRRFPQTRLWLNPVDGRVIGRRDPRQDAAGDTVLAWLHPLHNGEAFGLAGRWLVVVAGIVPVMLLVTGIWRWRHRRHATAAVAGRIAGARIGDAVVGSARQRVPEK